jgi:hypothetical protein
LEALFELLGEEGEEFADFTDRIRAEYDADDEKELLDAFIEVPEVPENCNDETKAAMEALQTLKEDFEDCLSFYNWAALKLEDSCDALADSFQDIIDDNTPEDAQTNLAQIAVQNGEETDDLYAMLFNFIADEGEDLEAFRERLEGEFAAARADPDGGVAEQETGIEIADVPEQCPDSTRAARDALVAFEADL